MQKKKKRLLAFFTGLLLILVLIMGVAIGYLIQNNDKKEGDQNEVVEEEDAQEDQSEDEDMVIHTDYGDLYYPEQWSAYLKTEQNMEDDSLQVSFSAHLEDQDFLMFQVTIGDSEDTEVGELTDSSGTKRKVYMSVVEIEPGADLSEEEQQRLYAMQEDLNYLIDHLA